jgi:hypothetical protein
MNTFEENFKIFYQPDGWYWCEKEYQEGEWYKPTMTKPMGPFQTKDEAKKNAINWLDH